MERFDALSDSAIAFSGDYDEFNDPDTSPNEIGSGPELGGTDGEVSTYDDLNDEETTNLTGQSDTAMLANAPPQGTATNPAGSGSAGQQVASVAPDPAATDAVHEVSHPGTAGAVLTSIFKSPSETFKKSTATLTQTSQAGISLHGNLVLFFILGIILGVIALNYLES